jgi:N-acyl-D-aspartate/D-glutamate deacylase
MSPSEFVSKLNNEDFKNKIKNLIFSGKIKFHMIHPVTDPYWMDCYMILKCTNDNYIGKTIWKIAREKQPDYTIDAVYNTSIDVLFEIICEDSEASWALKKDKREAGSMHIFLQHPLGIPCSDIFAKSASATEASPTEYNIFPMFLQKMVKEIFLLSLEEAIRKITSFPAKVFDIKDRGILKPGAYADIVIMDFENLKVFDDFLNPTKHPEGIKYVIVNGQIACDNATLKDKKSGKVLRKKY